MTVDTEASNGERRRYDTDLLEAFDRVRDELRREVRESEGRVQASLADLRDDFEAATKTHAGIHAVEGEARSIAHKRYEDFMLSAELAQARRDGALGVIRFSVDLIGRNWRGIAAVAIGLGVVLGNVHVGIGVAP